MEALYTVAVILQVEGPVLPGLPWRDVLPAAAAVFLLWYLTRKMWVHTPGPKASRLCPACFSPELRRSHRRGWELLTPFLRPCRCKKCGTRFVRGGRPPFACCPACGSPELRRISQHRVRGGFRNTFRRMLGSSHGYRCPKCRIRFLDSRPLVSSRETKGGKLGPKGSSDQLQPT
jgi:hypothetical protein